MRKERIEVNAKAEHLSPFQLNLVHVSIAYLLQVEHSQILDFVLPSLLYIKLTLISEADRSLPRFLNSPVQTSSVYSHPLLLLDIIIFTS